MIYTLFRNAPMDNEELCPCGSGNPYETCCKQQYDAINSAREKLKQAMLDPKQAAELKDLLKQAQQK